MIDLDPIDKGILALLGKNGRLTGHRISKELSEKNISLTDRAVLQRIGRLEKRKIIQGYTTTLNPAIVAEKSPSNSFPQLIQL
jgi:Lrp/AsnC family transcriptional regulator, leucine-responsive regulatory protein